MTKRILIIGTGAVAESAARALVSRFIVQRSEGENRAALRETLKGCYGVFAPKADVKLVAVVAGAEVEHFVVASNVEMYARCLGVPSTFIRNIESGADVAAIFDRPEEFIGRTIDLGAGHV